jgi:hypothetical protein
MGFILFGYFGKHGIFVYTLDGERLWGWFMYIQTGHVNIGPSMACCYGAGGPLLVWQRADIGPPPFLFLFILCFLFLSTTLLFNLNLHFLNTIQLNLLTTTNWTSTLDHYSCIQQCLALSDCFLTCAI